MRLEWGQATRTEPSRAVSVVWLRVNNQRHTRRFYEGTLGLVPREEYAGGVIYECGRGTVFFMYPSAGAGTSKASDAFWTVNDVEAEVAELKSRGVKETSSP